MEHYMTFTGFFWQHGPPFLELPKLLLESWSPGTWIALRRLL
jgi:hypothetical protein